MNFKSLFWRILGKDAEAVVVSFLSGPGELALAMLNEVRSLVPDREHWAVTDKEVAGVRCIPLGEVGTALRGKRIGLAPVLIGTGPEFDAIRRAAFRYAPHKLLAYNKELERHHLRPDLSSLLFWRGVSLDRIHLRPAWLVPWKRDRSVIPDTYRILDGRPLRPGRPRVAILTPYFPWPLSHGGAVRIYHLLREAARDFDLFLFAFQNEPNPGPIAELCSKIVIVPIPRYREPRWSSLEPPEVAEFRVPLMAELIERLTREYGIGLVQVEYTQLASYKGDVLVEHDVTFDLYRQLGTNRQLGARWSLSRWLRFEKRALHRFRRVVAMSEKDAALLASRDVRVIPNGVDLDRFTPEPETAGHRLLFVGSFRHFPNVMAYRFLMEQIWPLVLARMPDARLVVVAGENPERYWSEPPPAGVDLLGFVSHVRPLYVDANLVVVPTQVSAGTNLKVLEAMAMERAVVSTSSGCAGIGLRHSESVWIADTAADFAEGIIALLDSQKRRASLAAAARKHCEAHFDWKQIGRLQKTLWEELLPAAPILVRVGAVSDLDAVARIQQASPGASTWDPASYLNYELLVAEVNGEPAGFVVARTFAGETEVLNLAVAPGHRRRGVASTLLRNVSGSDVFLEVRESNQSARNLYLKLGFTIEGQRANYYDHPPENALVMRLSRSRNHANV